MPVVQTFHPADPKKLHGDPFGVIGPNRRTPHRGIDYAVRSGTPLRAIGNGSVVATYWSDVIGWVLEIRCMVLVNGKRRSMVFAYCHLLEDPSEQWKVGDKVTGGEVITKSGNSGARTTGAHLHLMAGPKPRLSVNAVVDPLPLITASIKPVDVK